MVHVLKGVRGRREDTAVQQQEDIAAVGSLMVRLAGGAANGPALQALAGHLSPHLLHLLSSLQNSHIRDCHMVPHHPLSPWALAPSAAFCMHVTWTPCMPLLLISFWIACLPVNRSAMFIWYSALCAAYFCKPHLPRSVHAPSQCCKAFQLMD